MQEITGSNPVRTTNQPECPSHCCEGGTYSGWPAALAQRSEQSPVEGKALGSNPGCGALKTWGCSSVGRATLLQGEGRGFDSPLLHKEGTVVGPGGLGSHLGGSPDSFTGFLRRTGSAWEGGSPSSVSPNPYNDTRPLGGLKV